MALIKCEECGHMMSDAAQRCPKCGCPTSIHFMEIYYEGSSTFRAKGTIKLKINGEEINHGGNFKDGLSTKILLKTTPVVIELSTFGKLRKVNFTLDVNPAKNSRLELKYDTDIGFFTEAEYIVEGSEVVTIKASKVDKRRIYLFCFILFILFVGIQVYFINRRSRENMDEFNRHFNELIQKQAEKKEETNKTENEAVSPSEESENVVNARLELTEEYVKDCFLRHWQHYKGDREFISLEECSEGYKVFISDLNGDGINDAVVNAYVTPSSEEIANNKTENKSYIFCFVNDGEHCKLATTTKLYAMFFVDNIDNEEIHAHRIEYMKRVNDGQKTAIKDSHIFRFDGDKLVDLGGTKRLVDEQENPQIERKNENAGLSEGCFYRYEGDMKGFPIKVDFGILSNGVVNGEYQNVKYSTVLELTGRLTSDKSLQLVGENQNEKIVFELSFSSPEHLEGYGKMGDNSLEVKLKLISSEVINDSH